MSEPSWQLPWAGPRLVDPDKPSWSVMPSPGLGDADAICVPVRVMGKQVLLALAGSAAFLPVTQTPLGQWTEVVGSNGAGHTGYLCLLRYDQPRSDMPDSFFQEYKVKPLRDLDRSVEFKLALELKFQSKQVSVKDLTAALATMQKVGVGRSVLQEVLPLAGTRPRSPPPSAASAPLPAPGVRAAGRPSADAAPLESAASLALAFGSCQYPAGLLDAAPAEASLGRLADLLDPAATGVSGQRPPELVLLLGDQIYADATAGLLDPVRLDDRYRMAYENWLRIEPLRRIMRRVRTYTMLDDHEIADNWEPYATGATGRRFRKGVSAYWTYQRGAALRGRAPPGVTWFTLPGAAGGPGQGQGWSLFMADTRTQRQPRYAATSRTAEILGDSQGQALEAWLSSQPNENLKLIAAPAMLLPRLREYMDEPLHLDNWQGYPASMARLLAFICDKQIRNVCYLSGDAHLGCDARITVIGPGGLRGRLRALHAPALYAPLPFANEHAYNLAMPRDQFEFSRPGIAQTYRCQVAAATLPNTRDGCCLLTADRDAAGRWEVGCSVI